MQSEPVPPLRQETDPLTVEHQDDTTEKNPEEQNEVERAEDAEERIVRAQGKALQDMAMKAFRERDWKVIAVVMKAVSLVKRLETFLEKQAAEDGDEEEPEVSGSAGGESLTIRRFKRFLEKKRTAEEGQGHQGKREQPAWVKQYLEKIRSTGNYDEGDVVRDQSNGEAQGPLGTLVQVHR